MCYCRSVVAYNFSFGALPLHLAGELAQLFGVPTFRAGVLATAAAAPGSLLAELASVFAHLAASPCAFADTAALHRTLRGVPRPFPPALPQPYQLGSSDAR